MPLPIIVPTTTAEAWLTPKSRASSGRCVRVGMGEGCKYTLQTGSILASVASEKKAASVAEHKCHRCPDQYPPCPREVRPTPQVQIRAESQKHAYHGSALVGALRKHSEQEDS